MSQQAITVVVPTFPHPERALMLANALRAIALQTRPPEYVIVPVDRYGMGAAWNHNNGLSQVQTPYVAFTADDDELYPDHLESLENALNETGADIIYPWFKIVNTRPGEPQYDSLYDPLAIFYDGGMVTPFGKEFGPQHIEHLRNRGNFIPGTVLAKTELLQKVGGFSPPPFASPDNPCEDWGCWLKCLDAGATFYHVPRFTWQWNWHPGNTSGQSWTNLSRYGVPR